MKTFAQLKRDLKVGVSITMTKNQLANEKFSANSKSALIGMKRYIVKTQSNGVYLTIDGSQKSYLEFPPASLVEYNENIIRIYNPGERKLTKEEQTILDNRPSNRKENEQLAVNDALTDGSSTFWMDKRYYSENGADWYWGWSKGQRYSQGKMIDNKIKGALSLEYELEGSK